MGGKGHMLRFTGIFLLIILLVGALVIPVGFSEAQLQNQTENSGNQTNTTPLATTLGNQTSPTPTNQTQSQPPQMVGGTDIENLGQQVSAFVHQAMEIGRAHV